MDCFASVSNSEYLVPAFTETNAYGRLPPDKTVTVDTDSVITSLNFNFTESVSKEDHDSATQVEKAQPEQS